MGYHGGLIAVPTAFSGQPSWGEWTWGIWKILPTPSMEGTLGPHASRNKRLPWRQDAGRRGMAVWRLTRSILVAMSAALGLQLLAVTSL